MDEKLLENYNRELLYLREMGGEFARNFPKVAGRLGLDSFSCADPYVERLLEGFAFLAARVQYRLDESYPQLHESLLSVLYPHYLAPMPAMLIAGFIPDMQEGSLYSGYQVPRGTQLKASVAEGQQTACIFSTAFDLTLWPLEIYEGSGMSSGIGDIELPVSARGEEAVRLRLRCLGELPASELSLDKLRLHLRGSQGTAMSIFEALQTRLTAVSIIDASTGNCLGVLPAKSVTPVGFQPEEALLPQEPYSYPGYRLLREYFAFPERFLFLDISGLHSILQGCTGREFDLVFTFRRGRTTLPETLEAGNFRLFCVPAVNVFPMRCDNIILEEHLREYHLVVDRTRPHDFELFHITSVRGFSPELNESQEFRPLYSSNDADPMQTRRNYYLLHRHDRLDSGYEQIHGPRSSYSGSEVFISLTDSMADRTESERWRYLSVQALCTNRDLPLKMPRDLHGRDFTLEEGMPVESIACLTGPTAPKPAPAVGKDAWQIISHLSLNYLSLSGEGGAAALREMLSLYSEHGELALREQVRGIAGLQTKPVLRRLPGQAFGSLARGIGVEITFDDQAFEGVGGFLLGMVLADFFRQYVSINSFAETSLRTSKHGEIARWEASPGVRRIF